MLFAISQDLFIPRKLPSRRPSAALFHIVRALRRLAFKMLPEVVIFIDQKNKNVLGLVLATEQNGSLANVQRRYFAFERSG